MNFSSRLVNFINNRLVKSLDSITITKRYSSSPDFTSNIHSNAKITHKMEFIEPFNFPQVPMLRLLNKDGSISGEFDTGLTNEKILEMYKGMLTLNAMDKIMFESHRQGRISFYMTNFGEEAVQFGSVSALEPEDWIYAQYRESGVLIYRGMDISLMMAQCFGNKQDINKGRQMPIHYGSKAQNCVTISSTLATQMPQAAGTAYAFKKDNSGRIVACFFGEGASSEGDAHAAMNFAATLGCPVIFICRNNGYAISTPASEQYRGDGIVSRGLGYGMCSIRVDGNDLFAVHSAIKAARQICVDELRPVLVEAITYRVGHHSTSDDSSAYRSVHEVKDWVERDNPISRVFKYLKVNNAWTDIEDEEFKKHARVKVLKALREAGKMKKLNVLSMFDEIYDEIPDHIEKQREHLQQHLQTFGSNYPLTEHDGIAKNVK